MESSERRRMKPTCGPLPCVSTTFQPLSIMPATSSARPHTMPYWSGIDSCVRSRISALPPIASTARPLEVTGNRAPTPIFFVQRRNCVGEAGERRVRDAGTDLADAGLLVGDAGVDHRQDAAV